MLITLNQLISVGHPNILNQIFREITLIMPIDINCKYHIYRKMCFWVRVFFFFFIIIVIKSIQNDTRKLFIWNFWLIYVVLAELMLEIILLFIIIIISYFIIFLSPYGFSRKFCFYYNVQKYMLTIIEITM